MIDYLKARLQLVENLKRKGIRNPRVLDAMQRVERERFVKPHLRARSYEDRPLSIGERQTISQPFMVAFMTELLGLKGDERVLEVGTGSGYQAAILAYLADKVYTIERISSLAESAKKRFEEQQLTNIFQHVGDGTLGWEEHAPYDAIIVTAAAPDVPSRLVEQLDDKGTLIIPTGGRSIQELKRVRKKNGKLVVSNKGGCVFVPLIGSDGWT